MGASIGQARRVLSRRRGESRLSCRRDARRKGAQDDRTDRERGRRGGAADRHRRQAITVIGAPIEAGAGVAGCAMGPAMLRTAGIVRTLGELGHDVVDLGDLAPGHAARATRAAPEGRARYFAEIAAWTRDLVARDPRDPARGAAAAGARRRPQPGDGVDHRRRALRRRGRAEAVRPVARRPFGLQHAENLARRATCTACRSRC